MRPLQRVQSLAVAIGPTLRAVGVVGMAMAQHGYVVPPDLDVSLSDVHIVAYVTSPII
jgi:hypothetical protein